MVYLKGPYVFGELLVEETKGKFKVLVTEADIEVLVEVPEA